MRTVHETEALRPSDPVPKSMQQTGPAAKGKLKIIIKTPQSHAAGHDDSMNGTEDDGELSADLFTPLTEEQGFTTEEREMPLERLYKLCHFQVKWAREESRKLHEEIKFWEAKYKEAWLEKEVLVSQVIKSDLDWHERRQAVLSGYADVRLRQVLEAQEQGQDEDGDAADETAFDAGDDTVLDGADETVVDEADETAFDETVPLTHKSPAAVEVS